MSRRLAIYVDDNNLANDFFVLRLPEICGSRKEDWTYCGKGKKEDWFKETKDRAEQKGVEESTDTNALRVFPSSSNN